MVEIYIKNTTSKKISKKNLLKLLSAFFEKQDISQNSEVSVIVVDKDKMLEYVHKYLHETGTEAEAHPVLSFVQNEIEGPFTFPPDKVSHLGEIIVSIDHAKDEQELYDLIEHGALHLLGIHHD